MTDTDDVDAETIALSLDPDFRALIERSRRRNQFEKRLTSEEMRRLFKDEQRPDDPPESSIRRVVGNRDSSA